MCAVVINDQMQIEMLVRRPVDAFQEADELLCAVTWQAFTDDEAGLDVECCKQCRGAMAFVVVGHGGSASALHR